ncbi:eukaryotic aspartyl protease [Ophiocordyceps camponoti-floridani]|uniref:Eukaryotic aspartyl protease n=1 Tax=Ophiocordyceps camponoti-floridani TaxID=2030778 RepID=A0A8H4VEN6_9HYPO|nr:eukaryotic aspartyl protease [Ophiocordyceps camponoti-floridani]
MRMLPAPRQAVDGDVEADGKGLVFLVCFSMLRRLVLLALAASVESTAEQGWDPMVGTLPVIDWDAGHVGKQRRRDGALSLAIEHMPDRKLERRQVTGSVDVNLTSRADVSYYVKLAIGNPPQNVSVHLDTGSFELWVNPDCGRLGAADKTFCKSGGRYEPSQSDTSVTTDVQTTLRYGIGSANITYVEDSVAFPGTDSVMQGVRFGVADSSRDQFAGILGLGFGDGLAIPYPTFMDQLKAQKVTQTKTLAVGLGAKDEGGGTVTFGGLDTSKFSGRLAAVPIIPAKDSPDKVPRYWVTVESVSHSPPGKIDTTTLSRDPIDVFLDTGATLTFLPETVVDAMGRALNSTRLLGGGLRAVDCRLAKTDEGAFGFRFNGLTVFVPYDEMIREMPSRSGQGSVCYLGVMPSSKFALLGDTFLRSSYVVLDLDGRTAYMARYSNCGSTVETITPKTKLKAMAGKCREPKAAQLRLTSADDAVTGFGTLPHKATSPPASAPHTAPPAPAAAAAEAEAEAEPAVTLLRPAHPLPARRQRRRRIPPSPSG